MPVKYKCELLACVRKEFDSSEGDHVLYYECYFLNENEDGERSVVRVNTKTDYSKKEGKGGTLTLDLDVTGSRKPRLVSFEVGSE